MAHSVLEICSGAGGQALGFEAAGFEHAALVDSDSHACATLRMNRPYWNVVQADIFRLDACYWRGIDVLAGGLPCPPFSVAGRQLGNADERNLFPALMRLIGQTCPRAVVVENVRGLMMRRFADFREATNQALQDLGYCVHWQLLNAVHHGVPQTRTRVFLVALRKGSREFRWPAPNDESGTVGSAIGEMMAEDGWTEASRWAKQADRPAPTLVGGSLKHGGPDLGPTRARKAWAEIGVDGLGVADRPPAPDFRGMPRLTVKMAARLQGFPDGWALAGTKTQRYRQIGNALPPNLAQSVARSVTACLD